MFVFAACSLAIFCAVNVVARWAWKPGRVFEVMPHTASPNVYILDDYRAARMRSVARHARRGAVRA